MRELQYPFDAKVILKRRRFIKKQLLSGEKEWIEKRVAILGGSTTHDIKDMLELFLLNQGIRAVFYESEYNQFYEEVMFGEGEVSLFHPDLIYIHTSSRNITLWPEVTDDVAAVEDKLQTEMQRFTSVWQKALDTYQCPIIANNFELPYYRLMGNLEFADIHGRINFVNRLNLYVAEFAQSQKNFYINDILYLSSEFGCKRWADPFYWHAYKYACAVEAIPALAFNITSIIKAIYGKNQKAFMLDLDNTLWGGVVGDDGAENIQIGQESPEGQVYAEFQSYIKAHKDLGVILTVNSKNEEENALAGLSRPDTILKPDDFVNIKANWQSKDRNAVEIAEELNIGTDAFVFVDDNPAEREIVCSGVSGVIVPEMGDSVDSIRILDGGHYFETVALSKDDKERTNMYKANVSRAKLQSGFSDYGEYLSSLQMKAEIAPFSAMYMARIAQLTNKSNQFNLTTKRCTQSELEHIAENDKYITLYGKLKDKFGDNGVVSVVYGHIEKTVFHIDLWLMSCRVLKRGMEDAMMDTLVSVCVNRGIRTILGYYYPTKKNSMVKEFYSEFGYDKIEQDEQGNTIWQMDVSNYKQKNIYIEVESYE